MQPELEQSAVFEAAWRKFRSNSLGILDNLRESLIYSTGLVKHSDHSSLRKLLRLNDSVATSKIKNMFDMVSGKKRGGEHQGDSQAKVDIFRVSSNQYLCYFDRVLIRGQLI